MTDRNIQDAILAERERCHRIVQSHVDQEASNPAVSSLLQRIANLIRSGSELPGSAENILKPYVGEGKNLR